MSGGLDMPAVAFEDFAALQGQHFALLLDDGAELQAQLVQVQALPAPAHDGRTPFSLRFRGPAAPLLPQRIYRMRPATAAETLDIFIVPVGADATGVQYEAIFS